MGVFNDLAARINKINRSKGFYEREFMDVRSSDGQKWKQIKNPSFPSEKLMLIVSEVSEAQEKLRDRDLAGEEKEIADIIIRSLDYAYWRGFDMDKSIEAKVAFNETRPHHHGRPDFG